MFGRRPLTPKYLIPDPNCKAVWALFMPTIRPMKAKLALCGDAGVGKTSLIRRFVLDEYQDTYLQTLGTKVSKVDLSVPYGADTEVRLDMSIFDIMGQTGFRETVSETYFHGAQGLLAVADLTRKESLDALNEWIQTALGIAGEVPVYLLVNKKDLEAQRAIEDEEIRRFAESHGAPYLYASAKTGEFVEDAFYSIAIEVVDRAFRREQARVADRGIREKVLVLLEKRGAIGLRKGQMSQILKGVNLDELQTELRRLEGEGMVTLMWYGPSDFTVTITPRGAKSIQQGPTLQEE